MRVIDLCESEKRTFTFPHRRGTLLNPVAGNRKVSISVAGLPRVASYIDGATDSVALQKQLTEAAVKALRIRTFNVFLSVVRWDLNMRTISARVAFRPGILTPLVARDATSIISLNLG